MSRPYRFGVQGGPFTDATALAEHARKVESLGYAELWSYDHIGAVDPFAPLLTAALATKRLRVGPLVLNNEFHHPAFIARTAATVDALTGGRLTLGWGTGYALDEHAAIGVELRPPRQRVERLGESLGAVRNLLDTGTAELDGVHLQLAVRDIGPRPVQAHVPFLVGGHGRRMVGVAARYADIYQFTGLSHGADGSFMLGGFDPAELDVRSAWLVADAGDRHTEIERSALVQAVVVDDPGAAAALPERFELPAEVLADTPFVLAGSVAQIIDKIGRLRERLGISHYVVRDPTAFAPVVDALT
jgi:probable F420-dependent oxidoreductase